MLKITADEVNFLVHQYLEETGYKHTAFTFRYESNIEKSPINDLHVPPSMLLMYLEKALLLLQMETHLDKDDEVILCNQPFTLLNPHICAFKQVPIEKARPTHDDDFKRASTIPAPFTNPIRPEIQQHPPPTPDSQLFKPITTIMPSGVQQNVMSVTSHVNSQDGLVHTSMAGNVQAEVHQQMQIDTPRMEEKSTPIVNKPKEPEKIDPPAIPPQLKREPIIEEEKQSKHAVPVIMQGKKNAYC